MRNTRRLTHSSLMIALLLSIAGCKQAEVLGIQKSPTFSAAALSRDGAVIGAVVSAEP